MYRAPVLSYVQVLPNDPVLAYLSANLQNIYIARGPHHIVIIPMLNMPKVPTIVPRGRFHAKGSNCFLCRYLRVNTAKGCDFSRPQAQKRLRNLNKAASDISIFVPSVPAPGAIFP
jgi:hypothetical protein